MIWDAVFGFGALFIVVGLCSLVAALAYMAWHVVLTTIKEDKDAQKVTARNVSFP